MTEHEAAKLIAEGNLPSPYKHSNITLFAVRVTGTGMAFRDSLNEYVWRDPSLYLNDEFLARVSGLPLVWEHPEKGSLNSKEFNTRVIGACMFGYIQGNDVWAIARVYDDEAIELMSTDQLSTSPGVVFSSADGNVSGTTSEGETLLVEGRPSTLCHLAVCAQGVWDKGSDPVGVQNDLINPIEVEDSGSMADEHEEKAAADKARSDASDKFDAIMDAFRKMDARMDSFEKEREDARKDAERKDAEAKEKDCMDSKDRKDGDDEMMDKRKDSKRKDKDFKEWAKEEEEEPEHKEDKKRKDSEAEEDKEEEEKIEKAQKEKAEEKKEDSRKDSVMREENEALKSRLAKLERAMLQVTTEIPGSERDALAAAQNRADSIAAMLGDRAPPAMPGETSLDYRRRLIKRFAPHSPTLKGSRFDMIDEGQLQLAEDRVYADAAQAARSTGDAAPGVLIPFEERDRAGRVITKYHGDIAAFMQPFMTGATVGRINRKPGA